MVSITLRRKKARNRQTLDRLVSNLRGPDKVKVGFPAGEADSEIVMRAVYNEFGTSRGIPERPFIRNAVRGSKSSYLSLMKRGALRIVRGDLSKRRVLEQLGLKAVGDIQRGMPGTPPPNAPSTVAQKGSSATLVDTGQMRQSVTHKVEDP